MSEERVIQVFLLEGLCGSAAEAESILANMHFDYWKDLDSAAFAEHMSLCFDLTDEAIQLIYAKIHKEEKDETSDVQSSPEEVVSWDDDDDDDGAWIGEGECELCERTIPLTRHHLIPRSTWPRYETRLLNAFAALDKGNADKALVIAGEGLAHLLDDYKAVESETKSASSSSATLTADRRHVVRQMMQRVCLICTKCHSAIHRTHDNMTLGISYNTVDKLIADPAIYRFCQWASKQRYGARRY